MKLKEIVRYQGSPFEIIEIDENYPRDLMIRSIRDGQIKVVSKADIRLMNH